MDEDNPPSGSRPKFRDKLTERFAKGERIKPFHAFKEQAERRLDLLEALGGDRRGQFSIRINQQWRVCFEWPEDSERPFNIEIVDYH